MFGFACRSVYPRCPWPWKSDGGPAGEDRPRLPRGLLGGQTVVLLTVWATALVCGVALAGPPGAAPHDGGEVPVAAADAADDPPARPAVATPVAPSAGPPAAADAGSDAADREGERAFAEEALGLE